MNNFEYVRPASVAEALSAAADRAPPTSPPAPTSSTS